MKTDRSYIPNRMRGGLMLNIAMLMVSLPGLAQTMPPPLDATKGEPVVYTGGRTPDPKLYDGGLPHAMGVHHYQVLRANRTHPPEQDGATGWTYNHQPYLAYWNGKFYLQYLSGERSEHTPPTRVLITTSVNGRDWSAPETAFPTYALPLIRNEYGELPAGTGAVMHQRMGFYVAPNGKLLTLAFYSYTMTPRFSPNAGQGLGRVVREIRADGSYGPIYFIRYNRHAGFDEGNTRFPFYATSPDTAFVNACKALLNDKLVTLQWWEEDRGKDGFFAIDPSQVAGGDTFAQHMTTSAGAGKAFAYYHRPDGVVVGLWKNQWSALSDDDGRTWTPLVRNTTLNPTGAKVWGQRVADGTYALVHNQTAGNRNRYPMVVMAGADGHRFDRMYSLRDYLPPRRYQGLHKGYGPQYYRGITEGNGNPPGDPFWVVYSVNKEDIWIARIGVPITGEETADVHDDFNTVTDIAHLDRWNLYVPQWAPVSIGREAEGNRYLLLTDEDPYDQAQATRRFPESKHVDIQFRLNPLEVHPGRALEIEVQDGQSQRPLRLRIDDAWLMFDQFQVESDPLPITPGVWTHIRLAVDTEAGTYHVFCDGALVREAIPLAVPVQSVDKVLFRTGPYGGYTPAYLYTQIKPATSGLDTEDLPGADQQAARVRYGIDDLSVTQRTP